MIMLHRLLEPPIAELFQRPAYTDGSADRIAVIGIEREWEIRADQASHRAGLGDVTRDVDVGFCPVIVETDLDRGRIVFEAGFDNPQHLVDTALAITADR